jgi:hypothetical protein
MQPSNPEDWRDGCLSESDFMDLVKGVKSNRERESLESMDKHKLTTIATDAREKSREPHEICDGGAFRAILAKLARDKDRVLAALEKTRDGRKLLTSIKGPWLVYPGAVLTDQPEKIALLVSKQDVSLILYS